MTAMSGTDVHILINTLRLGDATSQHAFDLARALLQAGHEVQLLANFPPGPLPDDLRERIRQVHPGDYQPSAALTIVEYPLWYPLAERIREAPGARLFWYHGVTDPALWPTQGGADVLRNSLARTRLAWRAHLAVVTSPFTAAELIRHAGLPRERIHIVPLGVDLRAFADPALADQAQALRRRLKLGQRRVLLYVGRAAEHKRIDLLIDALAQLCGRDAAPKGQSGDVRLQAAPTDPDSLPQAPPSPPHSGGERSARPGKALPQDWGPGGRQTTGEDVHLLIVGDQESTVETRELAARLQAQARRLGVADRVTFTGRVDDVAPYYRLAHVYLQASQHEGFGVPLVEAMAAGTPVVAAAAGAMVWVLGGGDEEIGEIGEIGGGMAGLVFEAGDVDGLVRQVRRLLDDPALHARLAEAGRARAQAFSLERFYANAMAAADEAVALASQGPPETLGQDDPLYAAADVALRDYRPRSGAPGVGQFIEWTRVNATTHIKEAYVDRMVEAQVNYNRQLAEQIVALRQRVDALQAQLAELQAARSPKPPAPSDDALIGDPTP